MSLRSSFLKAIWPLLSAAAAALVNAATQDLPSAQSFYVPSLPNLHEDKVRPLRIYAGHLPSLPVANHDLTPHLFFVMIKNRRMADKQRLMFWFNGGPGCSSFDGLMMELGPWRVDGKGGLDAKEGGWEEYTTMVYVDQPVGTGFAYGSTNKYVHSLQEASDHLVAFLKNFYAVFPEYKRVETYLAGESFAGQFIPYFADSILRSSLDLNLAGVAIGNGWMDARRQYPSYLEYGVKHGIIEENSAQWKKAKQDTDDCLAELDKKSAPDYEPINSSKCDDLLKTVSISRSKKNDQGEEMCMNIYDVRLDDTSPACGMNWPPDLVNITSYLRQKDTINALHATDKSESWTECHGRVQQEFHEKKSNSSITILPSVLARIPVLIFAGDQDFICNYMGLEAVIQNMEWNGEKGLGTVQTQSWSFNGSAAGTWVVSRNLTYAKIFNASHMAPYDQPHITHDMILRFMNVNFSAILDGSARLPSALGDSAKPVFIESTSPSSTSLPGSGKTPEQDKAMWEAYYNAGSAALVLVLIFLVIGTFLWCRVRRRRSSSLRLPMSRTDNEEGIPLTLAIGDEERDQDERYRSKKGKERAFGNGGGEVMKGEAIFEVGDSDEEDGAYKDSR